MPYSINYFIDGSAFIVQMVHADGGETLRYQLRGGSAYEGNEQVYSRNDVRRLNNTSVDCYEPTMAELESA